MAIEVGLLTCGSSYSPTPSQPTRGQWPALLVFVPAYSGASVRDLHPLPVNLLSIARIAIDPGSTITWCDTCQVFCCRTRIGKPAVPRSQAMPRLA